MKTFLIIMSIAAISCCSTSKNGKASNEKSVAGKEIGYETDSTIPVCIMRLIDQFKKEEIKNPPRSVYRYTYNGKYVYYVPAICCDFFSDLYDSSCKIIGHPDGGFTGRGDGSVPDFMSTRSNEKLIWKDERQ